MKILQINGAALAKLTMRALRTKPEGVNKVHFKLATIDGFDVLITLAKTTPLAPPVPADSPIQVVEHTEFSRCDCIIEPMMGTGLCLALKGIKPCTSPLVYK